MTHLGEKVSALVDGQLSLEAIERAHAHLAHCRACRDVVEAERLMKARLSCLSAPAPGADLVFRLLVLGGPSGPLPPRPGHVPGSPRPAPVTLPAPMNRTVTTGTALVDAPALASGPGRAPGGRGASARPTTYLAGSTRPSTRPSGRPAGRSRARLVGAVLGALGVVGAGASGLVLAGPDPRGGIPAQAPLDSFVQRPPRTGSAVPAGILVELRQNRTFLASSPVSSPVLSPVLSQGGR